MRRVLQFDFEAPRWHNFRREETEEDMRGELLRTKTSGPGKKMEVLEFVIARAARYGPPELVDWLPVGKALWTKLQAERGDLDVAIAERMADDDATGGM